MNKITYSAEYISYVQNGESAVVYITRDIAKDIPTKGMWVDVIHTDKKGRHDGRWDFRSFTVEIYPRKTKPVYPQSASEEEKKYITWQTAQKDIETQKKLKYRGPRYEVHPILVNRNKDKYVTKKAAWNVTFGQWVPNEWFSSSCEWRDKKVPVKAEWEYEIVSVKKL